MKKKFFVFLAIFVLMCSNRGCTDYFLIVDIDFFAAFIDVNSEKIFKKENQYQNDRQNAHFAYTSSVKDIEDTYGEGIEDNTIPIFTFNNGQFNVFEAMYVPFDPDVDGDFLETCKTVNEVLYETFITQMPDAVIDTLTNIEQIDNLDFYVFKIKISYPNKIIMNMLMYSRLFDKQMFALNIIFQDKEIGQKMLDAWKNSTFEK